MRSRDRSSAEKSVVTFSSSMSVTQHHERISEADIKVESRGWVGRGGRYFRAGRRIPEFDPYARTALARRQWAKEPWCRWQIPVCAQLSKQPVYGTAHALIETRCSWILHGQCFQLLPLVVGERCAWRQMPTPQQ